MMVVVVSWRVAWFSVVAVAALLLAGCGSSATPTDHGPTQGSIAGRVTATPTCPVERAGVSCPARPIVIEVQARAAEKVIASTHSGRDGIYRVRLPAGTYTLSAVTPNRYPRCTPRTVTVTAARTAGGNLTCDTGMR